MLENRHYIKVNLWTHPGWFKLQQAFAKHKGQHDGVNHVYPHFPRVWGIVEDTSIKKYKFTTKSRIFGSDISEENRQITI